VKNKGDFGVKLRSSQNLQSRDIFLEKGTMWVGENHTSARYSCIFAPCASSDCTGSSGPSNAHLSCRLGLFDTLWPPFSSHPILMASVLRSTPSHLLVLEHLLLFFSP